MEGVIKSKSPFECFYYDGYNYIKLAISLFRTIKRKLTLRCDICASPLIGNPRDRIVVAYSSTQHLNLITHFSICLVACCLWLSSLPLPYILMCVHHHHRRILSRCCRVMKKKYVENLFIFFTLFEFYY